MVNSDPLPGQPPCGRHGLDTALRGESPVDSGWWRELGNVQAVVARQGGAIVGAASYAVAPADRSGWLLWLHAHENRAVVEALIDHVLSELTGSDEVRQRLEHELAQPVLAISAVTGQGLAQLVGKVADSLAALVSSEDDW